MILFILCHLLMAPSQQISIINPNYVCAKDKNCDITAETKNRCNYCRFQKCLRCCWTVERICTSGPSLAKDDSFRTTEIEMREKKISALYKTTFLKTYIFSAIELSISDIENFIEHVVRSFDYAFSNTGMVGDLYHAREHFRLFLYNAAIFNSIEYVNASTNSSFLLALVIKESLAKTDFGEVFLKDYQAEITKIQTFFGGKIRKDLVAVLMLVSCMIGITPTSPIVYSIFDRVTSCLLLILNRLEIEAKLEISVWDVFYYLFHISNEVILKRAFIIFRH
ncbi:unnamed protein product [Dracunculus medinensis]|uniref:Nuclear receptor domain-containing protein n=1 Tax=Dracunculus medinensis TaxID=318479 RepID=A0A0N4UG34_DRAME|nr:unnamed protein product [Dracunculus medinensis]